MDVKVSAFISYLLNERRYSDLTIRAYQRDLKEFEDFLMSSGGVTFTEIAYHDVRLYVAFLTEKELSRTTIARKLSSLRSFFKYAVQQQWTDQNPMELIQYHSKKQRLPDFFYESEINSIIEAAQLDDHPSNKRNVAILELLYATGLRVSECCQLKTSQIDFNIQMIRVIGKGNKERFVYFGSSCRKAIDAYLPERNKQVLTDNRALFGSRDHNRISVSAVHRLVKKALLQAGLDPYQYSAHKLRHTAATMMLSGGVDVKTVQEVLGHENLNTTQIYTHIENTELKLAAEANPLSKLDFSEE